MKVLVVSASPPWLLSDGNSLILHHQMARLALRHDVKVLVPGGPPKPVDVPAAEALLPEGVDVRWYGTALPPALDYMARRGRSLLAREPAHTFWVERRTLMSDLRAHIERWKPDVLHLQTWGTAQLWQIAPDIPAVHSAVDCWTLNYLNRPLPGWRRVVDVGQTGLIERHEARHYPRCAAVMVVAPRDAEAIRSLAPSADVHVIPNGVVAGPDPEIPIGPLAPVLAYHGNFDSAATVDGAVALVREVLPAVRATHPAATVRLIGRNPGPAVLALAGAAVEVTGAVDDVRTALADSSVYVAAMVSGAGLKNKVLEAMAAGLPVVATEMAADGIGPGGGVTMVPSVGGMAAEIARILDDHDLRHRFGVENRARAVTEFTWDRSASALEALWERGHR